MTSRYAPLTAHLHKLGRAEISMTFEDIEAVLGFKLPPRASTHRAWFSNNPTNNPMTRAWLAAGYKSASVDMDNRKLVFRKTTPTKRPRASGGAMSTTAAGATLTAAELREIARTLTATELREIAGAMLTAAELREIAGAMPTAAELREIAGAMPTAAELREIAGAMPTAAELREIAGAMPTAAELREIAGAMPTAAELREIAGAMPTAAELREIAGAMPTAAELREA